MAVVIVLALMIAGAVVIVWLVRECNRMEKEMKNGEGYIDTTAGTAVMSVTMYEHEVAKENHRLIAEFRQAAENRGFEIVGRITLRHKKSGRMFK